MNIVITDIEDYKELIISSPEAIIDIGLLDKNERVEYAIQFIEAALDLLRE